MNIEIYVAAHKNSHKIDCSLLKNILLGAAGREIPEGYISDASLENISQKNNRFCELTALYWIWKNTDRQDYVGLMHYRRHLNFSTIERPEDTWGCIPYKRIDMQYILNNQINEISIKKCLEGYDLILPRKWDVTATGSTNLKDHYLQHIHCKLKDFDLAMDIVRRKHPDLDPVIEKISNNTKGYFTNIFIAKREIFDDYCNWLFDILFCIEKEIDLTDYSIQEMRVFGYLSEWLFNIYIESTLQKNVKIKEIQRTFVKNTSEESMFSPRSFENIPIVLSCNDKYAPYCGVTMQSIISNMKKNYGLDFFIFDGGISEENKSKIQYIISENAKNSVSYIDPDTYFSTYDLHSHSHFSIDTYYRLLIPEIFKNFEKIIYIDCDTIVLNDISNLYEIDIKNFSIAAVKDCVMQGFFKYKTRSSIETYSLETKDYLKLYLNIDDNNSYFQAGVLIFNIENSRKKIQQTLSILKDGKKFWFLDQDILNLVYKKEVKYIDSRWNVFHGNGNTQTFFKNIPYQASIEYFKSRENPFIIHFAGEKKPWHHINIDFSYYFWKFARITPWYEEILSISINGETAKIKHMRHEHEMQIVNNEIQKMRTDIDEKTYIIGIRDILRAFAAPFAPQGTKRRIIMRKSYNKMRAPFVKILCKK